MKLQEKAKWSIGVALSRLLTEPLENASELLEAANLLQGSSPFPAPAPTPTMSTTNAINDAAPNPANGDVEFDFRPYLDNQYFEPGSYNDQAGMRSSAESFLLPQDFEKLFSNPVKPALCPSILMHVRDNVQDMMQNYPLELLELPHDISTTSFSSGGVV